MSITLATLGKVERYARRGGWYERGMGVGVELKSNDSAVFAVGLIASRKTVGAHSPWEEAVSLHV